MVVARQCHHGRAHQRRVEDHRDRILVAGNAARQDLVAAVGSRRHQGRRDTQQQHPAHDGSGRHRRELGPSGSRAGATPGPRTARTGAAAAVARSGGTACVRAGPGAGGPRRWSRETGAGGGIRTPDPSLTKRLLYRLSYSGGRGAKYTDSAHDREDQPLRRTRITTSTLSISVPGGSGGRRSNDRSSGRMSIISPVSTFWK